MPSARLFPPLAPLPPRFGAVLAALLVTAALLLAPAVRPGTFPGDPALPYAPVTLDLHHQVHSEGLAAYLADDAQNLPYRTDRTVTDGYPLDALASWPFTAALGFEVGMWAYALALVWAVGASAAWLGARWWGSAAAGLVAGVAWQSAEAVLRELGEGRATQVFGAAVLPVALGLGALAASPWDGRPRPALAVAAGLSVAVAALPSWDLGLYALALALGPALLRRDAATVATVLAATAAVVGPAAAWVWSGISELPSVSADPWSNLPINGGFARPADLALARIHGVDGVALRTFARPVLLTLGVAGLWLARRAALDVTRPRWWPAVLLGGGVLFGLGFWLPGPVVMPWGLLTQLRPLSRLWWPDRAFLLVGLALALLAAGVFAAALRRTTDGASRARVAGLAGLAAAALLAEAHALSPALPLSALELAPSPAARAIAAGTGGVLVLPPGGGPLRPDRLLLVDRIHHGRPTPGGTRYPLGITASRALNRAWTENPSLRAIGDCELHSQLARDAPRQTGAALVHIGVREVWVDPRGLSTTAALDYTACVARLLGGWKSTEVEGMRRYLAPASLGRTDAGARTRPGLKPGGP